MNKLTLTILCLLVIIGGFFRLYRLVEIPPGLLQDEVIAGYDAYALGQTLKDHHGVFLPVIFQSFNDWTMPMLTYLLVPFMKFADVSAFWVRFPIAFLSTATIPLFFWFSYRLFRSKKIALICAFLATFSSFAITSGRWAIPPNTVIFFFLLGLCLVLESRMRSKSFVWLSTGMLVLGISIYTYPSMKVFLPLLAILILTFVCGWRKGGAPAARTSPKARSTDGRGISDRTHIKLNLLALIPLVITFPLYFLNFTNFSLYNNRFTMVSIFKTGNFWPLTFIANYFSYIFAGNLFLPGEVNPTRTVSGFGYELLTIGLFYFWGILVLVKTVFKQTSPQSEKKVPQFLLGILLVAPLGPALTVPAGDFQRVIYILPVILAISAFGLVNFSFVFSQKFNQKSWLVMMTSCIIILANFLQFWSHYNGQEFYGLSQWYYQDGLGKVYLTLASIDKDYEKVVVDSVINMPYAYYLFYNRISPRTLNYQDFSNINDKGWLQVEKVGKYQFGKIDESMLDDAKLISEIPNSPWSVYRIYEKEKMLMVVFALVKGEAPPGRTL